MLCIAMGALTFSLPVSAQEAETDSYSDLSWHVFDDIDDSAGQDVSIGYGDFTAGELSAGKGDDLNIIIGSDDRAKVGNTRVFPYSAVAYIRCPLESGYTGNLTGFFISPDTVITNAHGIFDPDSKAWARRVEVYPGYSDGVDYLGGAVAVSAVIHPNYLAYPNVYDQYDLAVIKLNKSMSVGYFTLTTSVSSGQSFRLIGYPYDKSADHTKYSQYESAGNVTQLNAEQALHNADTYGGNSGGAMLNASNEVIAVHSGGNTGLNSNIGVRLTTAKINWISSAKNSYLPVYRVYNPNSGEHFYTIDFNEKDTLVGKGWQDEGLAWSTSSSGVAVYRLYNSNGSEHHYTTSEPERDALSNAGWTYEKVAWYSPTSNAYPIYRLRNPNKATNNHHFTISASEKNGLVSSGWINEGVAWYGY